MNFNEYQKKALKTALYSGDKFADLTHWILGTVEESGEIAARFKRIIRDQDGKITATNKQEIAGEVGDVLWHLAVLSEELGIPFDQVAEQNLAKLADRHKRGKIKGKGDNR